MRPRTLIVGARTARQGTGRFLAGALSAEGAEVCALVGTSDPTARQAQSALASEYGIDARPYTDLQQALSAEQPQLVLLASPWQFHQQQLELIAAAGCHCLVEKPMLWPADEKTAQRVVAGFASRQKLLDVVGQWPFALAQFEALYGAPARTAESLTMRLSPISIDDSMIPDAAPHFISLLQALAGPGDFHGITFERTTSDGQPRMAISARFVHAGGTIAAELVLETVPERPRPAWFEINGLRAEREVELPEYRQHLVGNGKRVPLPDPMQVIASAYLAKLRRGEATDSAALLSAHRNLYQLAAAISG